MGEVCTVESDEVITTIALENGKVNPLSLQLFRELNEALDDAESVGHVVILTGRPGVFSAGFNLKELQSGDTGAELLRAGFEMSARLLAFPRPVVIACGGHALAMAAFLLLSADYRIGVEGDFKIGANEVAIGMTMPTTAIEICRQRVPAPFFGRVLNNAEIFTPADAIAPGFLDRVVPAEELMNAAREVATQLSSLHVRAHAATKLLTRRPALDAILAAIEVDDAMVKSLNAGLGG
jgi:enoyl-CoA hydratase